MTAILKPTHWSNQAAELLKQASGPMPTFSVSELEKAVNEGASSLFAGVSDGVIIGYIVVFVEGGEFASTISWITEYGASVTGLKSVHISDADPKFIKACEGLERAGMLKEGSPLARLLGNERVVAMVPVCLFAVGYCGGIFQEIKARKAKNVSPMAMDEAQKGGKRSSWFHVTRRIIAAVMRL